jgi:hypothetical protein
VLQDFCEIELFVSCCPSGGLYSNVRAALDLGLMAKGERSEFQIDDISSVFLDFSFFRNLPTAIEKVSQFEIGIERLYLSLCHSFDVMDAVNPEEILSF